MHEGGIVLDLDSEQKARMTWRACSPSSRRSRAPSSTTACCSSARGLTPRSRRDRLW